jgi:hypothetical protein
LPTLSPEVCDSSNRFSLPDTRLRMSIRRSLFRRAMLLRHPSRCGTSRCARRHDQLGHPGFRRPGVGLPDPRGCEDPAVTPVFFDRCLLPTIRFAKNGHPRCLGPLRAAFPRGPGAIGSRR